jgi:hypothetical protein
MSETKREYAPNYRKPPLHTRFKKGQSGNPRGRPKKNLPTLLVAALNEPVYVTTNGRRRKTAKRCREAGVEKIEAGPKGAMIGLRGDRFANPAGLVELIQRHAGTLKLRPDQRIAYLRN